MSSPAVLVTKIMCFKIAATFREYQRVHHINGIVTWVQSAITVKINVPHYVM